MAVHFGVSGVRLLELPSYTDPAAITPPEPQKKPDNSEMTLREYIETAGERIGVPKQLRDAIYGEESGFSHYEAPGVVKRGRYKDGRLSGALGVSQLMPATAARHKVDINDPIENAYGGLKEQKRLYDKYLSAGNSPNEAALLAAAAYNAGEGAVEKYHGIPPFEETQGYVSRIGKKLKKNPIQPGAGAAPVAQEAMSQAKPQPAPSSPVVETPKGEYLPHAGAMPTGITPETQPSQPDSSFYGLEKAGVTEGVHAAEDKNAQDKVAVDTAFGNGVWDWFSAHLKPEERAAWVQNAQHMNTISDVTRLGEELGKEQDAARRAAIRRAQMRAKVQASKANQQRNSIIEAGRAEMISEAANQLTEVMKHTDPINAPQTQQAALAGLSSAIMAKPADVIKYMRDRGMRGGLDFNRPAPGVDTLRTQGQRFVQSRQPINVSGVQPDRDGLKAAIRQQVLAERPQGKVSASPAGEGGQFTADAPTDVEDEVKTRYDQIQAKTKENQRLLGQMTPEQRLQFSRDVDEQARTILGSNWFSAGLGWADLRAKLYRLTAGVSDFANTLTAGEPSYSPKERSQAAATTDRLRTRALALEEAVGLVERTNDIPKKTEALRKVFNIVGDLAINSPVMLTDPILGFGMMSAAQARGHNLGWGETAKQAAVGAATGAAFKAGELFTPAGPGVLEQAKALGKQAATIGGGTFGVEYAAGTPAGQALESAITNVGLHTFFRAPKIAREAAATGAARVLGSESAPEWAKRAAEWWTNYQQQAPPSDRAKGFDAAPRVEAAIEEIRKQGPSPEAKAFFAGVEPRLAGTTIEKVSKFAKNLGIPWEPDPRWVAAESLTPKTAPTERSNPPSPKTTPPAPAVEPARDTAIEAAQPVKAETTASTPEQPNTVVPANAASEATARIARDYSDASAQYGAVSKLQKVPHAEEVEALPSRERGEEWAFFRVQDNRSSLPARSRSYWTGSERETLEGVSGFSRLLDASRDLISGKDVDGLGINYAEGIKEEGGVPTLSVFKGRDLGDESPNVRGHSVRPDRSTEMRFAPEQITRAWRDAVAEEFPEDRAEIGKMSFSELDDAYQLTDFDVDAYHNLIKVSKEGGVSVPPKSSGTEATGIPAPENVLTQSRNSTGSGQHEIARLVQGKPEWKARILKELGEGAVALEANGEFASPADAAFRTANGDVVTIRSAYGQDEPPTLGNKRDGVIIERKAASKKSASQPEGGVSITEVSAPTTLTSDATVDQRAHEAAHSPTNDLSEPTDAQKEAGNYKKGKVRIAGLDISIENPQGSIRSGVDKAGHDWSIELKSHYGYIRGYEGRDKDHLDVFVKPGIAPDYDGPVFVVNQRNEAGRFDEHKVMLGWSDKESAKQGYIENYDKRHKGIGSIASFGNPRDFKHWLDNGDLKKVAQDGKGLSDAETVRGDESTETEPVETAAREVSDWSDVREDLQDSGVGSVQRLYEDHDELVNRVLVGEASSKDIEKFYDLAQAYGLRDSDREAILDQGGQYLSDPVTMQSGTVTNLKDFGETIPQAKVEQVGHRLKLNDAAYELWRRLYVRPDDFEGALQKPGTTDFIRARLTGLIKQYPQFARQIRDLIRQMKAAAGDSGLVIVYRKEAALPHEGGHYASELGAKGKDYEARHARFRDLVRTAAYRKGAPVLWARNYPRIPGLTVEELFAFLYSGDRTVLGLSEDEADEFLDLWFQSYEEKNGSQSMEAFERERQEARQIVAKARATAKERQQDAGGVARRREKGITARQAGDRGSEAVAPAYKLEDQPDPKALLFKALYQARNKPVPKNLVQQSLFGATEEKKPAATKQPKPGLMGTEPPPGGWTEADLVPEKYPRPKVDAAAKQEETLPNEQPQSIATIDQGGIDENGPETIVSADTRRAGGDLVSGGRGPGEATGIKTPSTANAGSVRKGTRPRAEPESRSGQLSFGDAGDIGVSGIASKPARVNFTITNELDFSGVGARSKYQNNIEAIRLLRTLAAEEREATADEQSILARYVGWGGLKGVFDPTNKQWAKEHVELKDLLTPEEYKAANRSVLDAHYTSKKVVDAVWAAVKRLGLEHGAVLEPTTGTGNFIGLTPSTMKFGTRFTGVEYDNVTGAIAKHLYPQAKIYSPVGIQDAALPREHFDLAIGNPPFGDQSLYDSKNKEISKFKIHGFVFAKSLESVRPGGLLAMVVSKGLMDAGDGQAIQTRQWLGARARLLGAIRLPNTAFLENAGTEVTTDLIFLQKLAPGIEANAHEWEGVGQLTDKETGTPIRVNRYFIHHPEMMLGEMTLGGTMYRGGEAALIAHKGRDLAADLAEAIKNLPQSVYVTTTKTSPELAIDAVENMARPADLRPYNYYIKDGKLYQAMPDELEGTAAVAIEKSGRELQRIAGMVELRDIVRDLLRREAEPETTDAQLSIRRQRLNRVYDKFVQTNGHLSSDVNKRLMRDDADSPLLLALEKNFDKGVSREAAKKNNLAFRSPSAKKSDIFVKRTITPIRTVTAADSASDALLASLNEKGRVDLDYIQKLYGEPNEKTAPDIVKELGAQIYQDPDLGANGWVPSDAYLSGNVKRKLLVAREAAGTNPDYIRNVEALEKVQPKDVAPADIFVKLGTGWVPMLDYKQFVAETLEGTMEGRFAPGLGKFIGLRVSSNNQTLNTGKWGTKRKPATEIVDALMSNKRPKVMDRVPGPNGPVDVLNPTETAAAEGKAEELIEHFADWIWKDPERRQRLGRLYNDSFNNSILRHFDGAHLTLPGKTPNITMRPHQLNFIYRAIQDGIALADHVVGAGKTFAFISTVMEMRRLGLARKPMIVVPNHLVEQWAKDFKLLYPGSNVLAVTRKDFEKAKRRRLFAKIATGDWDAVIIAHSSFGFIPVPPEVEQRLLDEQLNDLISAIEEIKRDQGKKFRTRDLEKAKERIEQKLKRLADKPKDDLIHFAQMGVDGLFVDEAHEFKNLFFTTAKQGVAGLGNPAGSQKAFDMFIKTRHVQEQNAGKNVFFATGTPVANSIAEIFHMQRFLQFGALKENGIHTFDAWANTFGQDVSDWEMDAAGRFKQKTRFSKFANLPELKQLWNSVTDTIVNRDLIRDAERQGKRFPLPKIQGGKPNNIVTERSTDQAEYIGVPEPVLDAAGEQTYDEETGAPVVQYRKGTIIYRMDHWLDEVRNGNTKEIPLKITGDARKAGLDFRLIRENSADFPGSKVNRAAQDVYEIWKANDYRKGTQLVFCDLSTPKAHKGKATEAAAELQPTYFVKGGGEQISHVPGKRLKLSALADRAFFYYKDRGLRVVDAETGNEIGWGATRQEAIDSANTYIAKRGVGQYLTDAANDVIPPEQIEGYIADWEAKKQAEEEASGELDHDPVDVETTVSLDELLADQGTAFSVYDDLKAKLIAKGIPAEQVAFIHDYETDIQKQSLFDAVNQGRVRVLLGSTKKMGAGMNVQAKLVALHHLDCPWRPADLLQRDGRGIRQGNEFYEADPDGFELILNRYSTKQTYDARMWEIVEQKATAIETFKTDNTLREIEDISSESANAADMKADASGDPRILESIKLRSEIRKLEAQEKNWKRGRFDLEDAMRSAQSQTGYPWSTLKESQAALTLAQPKTDDTVINLDGQDFTVKDLKGDDARRALTPVLSAFKSADEHSDIKLGSYRGFDLLVSRNWAKHIVVTMRNPESNKSIDYTVYGAEDDFNLSGFVRRLDNMVEGLPKTITRLEGEVKRKEIEAKDAAVELAKPFSKAEQLAELKEKQRKLIAELRGGVSEPIPIDMEGLTAEVTRLQEAKANNPQSTDAEKADYHRVLARERKVVAARDKMAAATGVAYLHGEPGDETASEADMERQAARARRREGGFIINLSAIFPKSAEPRDNFSFLSAMQTRMVRGGAQLRAASEEGYEAFARAAGSRAQAAVISTVAAHKITKALGSSPERYHEFLAAGAESRLRGVEERWYDMARSLRASTTEETAEAYENGMRGVFDRVINHSFFDAERDMLGNILEYVDGLAAAGHWLPLRNYLADAFDVAGKNVAHISFDGTDDWFERFTAEPDFVRAMVIYKREVERPAAEAHALNEGVFSNALGPLDTWFPLIPVQDDGSLLKRMWSGGSQFKPYKRPVNVHNRMAMGLAQKYDLTPQMLNESIGKVLWSGNIAHLINTLEEVGLIEPIKFGQPYERVLSFKGVEYKASPVAITDPRMIFKDKKVINVPGRMALVPNFIRKELRTLLEGDFSDGAQSKFIHALNIAGMAGPLDAVFHSDNVIGALVSGTPFVGTSLLEKSPLLNNPLFKKINAIVNLLRIDPLADVNADKLIELAKMGVLPDRFASVTYSRAFAKSVGAKWQPYSFGPVLYGPKGLDVRARLLMYDIAKELAPNASPAELIDFMGQMGIYNKAMQSDVEKWLKKTGIAPFFTAGSTMLRNGIRAWTGRSKIPDKTLNAAQRNMWRLAQHFGGGVLGLIGLWILLHKLYRGKYPWEENDSRLLQVKLNDRERKSRLARKIYGDNDEPGYVGISFLSPLVERGGRALGIAGVYETANQGGSPGQMAERAERDAFNSLIHPITSGPASKALFVTATGAEPFLSQNRDPITGRFRWGLRPTIGATEPGLPTYYARAREGLLSWNNFNQKFSSEVFGIGEQARENEKHDQGGNFVRMALDLAVPRLIKGTYNRGKRAEQLAQQRKSVTPNVVNQLKSRDVKDAADFYRHAEDQDRGEILPIMLRKVQTAAPGTLGEKEYDALREAGLDQALRVIDQRRPVEKELQNIGLKFPQVDQKITIGANTHTLSDDQFDAYQKHVNDLFYERIPQVMASDDYKTADILVKNHMIRETESIARSLATAEIKTQLAPSDRILAGQLRREQVRSQKLGTNTKVMRLRSERRQEVQERIHPQP